MSDRFTHGSIRRNMDDHRRITKSLDDFNETFTSFILVSLLQTFFTNVAIIYGAIKFGFQSTANLLLSLENAVQFFTRGTIVMLMYGNVGVEAQDLKRILVTNHKTRTLASDPGLLSEITYYLSRVDQIGVCAGPYFTVSHGFLLSFYGTLITYAIILITEI
jgi:hypothetical protein